ncbi:ABC transporter permease [Photobacterium sp. MCCC 1A19761]|uniref:ABC transporter permease n=1 Tax=Photobacterium sp. MCCC 1A19761 TaxID=3115000 RepID=UPI00307F54FB
MNNIIDVILVLTQKEIKVRYKGSILGYLWSIIHPLLFSLVFFVAFKIFMRVPIENYTLFLICALFPWQFFANSTLVSINSYLANAQIVKKTNFPRFTLPLSNILMETVHFLISVPVIIAFLYYYNVSPNYLSLITYMPFLLALQVIFTYGISLTFSSLNVLFRDTERFISIGIMLLFYMTPIIYSVDLIPEEYASFIKYNPMSSFVTSWRDLFITGEIENKYFVSMLASTIISITVGVITYQKLKYKFAEIL